MPDTYTVGIVVRVETKHSGGSWWRRRFPTGTRHRLTIHNRWGIAFVFGMEVDQAYAQPFTDSRFGDDDGKHEEFAVFSRLLLFFLFRLLRHRCDTE